jgi:nucleolar MIF4G domain-containing protein 1
MDQLFAASGPQLRQEDPSSLKEIVMHLHSAIARIDPDEISVRTKFTIEMITDLKNNKMKTGLNASSITLEHLTRMKRILASIGQHRIKAAEPLRISLTDLHDGTKRGHWWRAGAKHRTTGADFETLFVDSKSEKQIGGQLEDTRDIQRLASEQRMNTDVRRSIFVNLMSASDCQDAYQRLIGLRLRRPQEPEIAKVLLHCAISEERYNPYYTLVADLLCSSRRMKISFQIALWEALNRFESAAFEVGIDHQVSEMSELRPAVHLAKMFAELVTEQKLDIKLIKNMQVESAHGPVHAFLEVFFLSICLRVRRRKGRSATEQSLLDIFRPLTDDAAKAHSVRAFFEGTLRNSDMVATTAERERLSQCCDIVESILQEQAYVE